MTTMPRGTGMSICQQLAHLQWMVSDMNLSSCEECDNIAVVVRHNKRLCARCWFDKELGVGGYEKTFGGLRKENISTKQRAWFVSPSNIRGNVP